jgi:hypothetical protein
MAKKQEHPEQIPCHEEIVIAVENTVEDYHFKRGTGRVEFIILKVLLRRLRLGYPILCG